MVFSAVAFIIIAMKSHSFSFDMHLVGLYPSSNLRLGSASLKHAEPERFSLPQVPLMERSTKQFSIDEQGDNEEQITSPVSKLPVAEYLYKPLHPSDPALIRSYPISCKIDEHLGVAEILFDSIQVDISDNCFTPPPNFDYNCYDEDCTDETYNILEIHILIQKAALLIHTFIVAALLLQDLTPTFYDEWVELCLTKYCSVIYENERTREVVIMAALVTFSLCTQLTSN